MFQYFQINIKKLYYYRNYKVKELIKQLQASEVSLLHKMLSLLGITW